MISVQGKIPSFSQFVNPRKFSEKNVESSKFYCRQEQICVGMGRTSWIVSGPGEYYPLTIILITVLILEGSGLILLKLSEGLN